MNDPDAVDVLLAALITRHRLCPPRAWARLDRAAARKGLSVADLCSTAVEGRVLATAGR